MIDEASELMFLLSSADRLSLLSALRQEKLRLTQISTRLSMTAQETSRQISRLQAARLIERDSQGAYTLTDLGRMALMLIPSFRFLAAWREYLVSHDLSLLPSEFVERIGELTEGELADTVGDVLNLFGEVLNQSQKYVWLMADQFLMQDSVAAKVLKDDGIRVRIVCSATFMRRVGNPPFPKEFGGRVELRHVEGVSAGLALNETVAGVTFPDKTGKLDFNRGFRGRDPLFHRWCEDLFMFHWNKARTVS